MASVNIFAVLAKHEGLSESELKAKLGLNSFDEERVVKLGKQAKSIGEEEAANGLKKIDKIYDFFRDDSDWRKIREILKVEIRRL